MNICKYCQTIYTPSRHKQEFCSISHAKKWQYKNGHKANTEKAHETLRTKGHYKRDNSYLKNNNPACSPDVRKKISQAKLGEKNWMWNRTGQKHHLWNGGKNDLPLWKSFEYQRWRRAVMRRDNYTCQMCGDNTGGNLEADHIKPKYLFPELTLDLDNGRTLCKPCHKQTPTWGYKVKKLLREDLV